MRKLSMNVLVAVVAVLMLVPVAARAQVLKQVPANALMVVKVNNLGATSAKLGTFLKQLGLVEMSPDLADPLAALQQKVQVSAGLNKAGEMALVMIDTGPTMDPEKSLLILAPVTDYKAFIGNFADAKTEGAITTATMAGDHELTYIAQWGEFAAMSPAKAIVSQKPAGLVVAGQAAKAMASNDLSVYGNMATIRARFMPKLKQERPKLLAKMEEHLGQAKDDQKKFVPVVRTLANQGLDAAEALLRDTQSLVWTMNLGKDGINSMLMAEFDPASYMGKTVGQFKNVEGSLLRGLPSGKYLMFGGVVTDPVVMGKLMDDLLNPALAQLRPLGADAKPIIDYVESIRAGVLTRTFGSFGILAPTGMIGADSLLQMISYSEGDAEGMSKAQKAQIQLQQQAMKTLNPAAPQPTVVVTPKAKTMDGVTLDKFQVNLTADPQNPAEQQAAQMIRMIYGPNGFVGYTGVVNAQRFLAVGGLNDVALGSAIAAAKAGTDAVGEQASLKSVDANLPAKRISAGYVAVDTLVTTALGYAKQFGFAVPVQIAPDQPPVGMALSTQGSAVRVDYYVPSQLVQNLVAAGIQMYQAQTQPQPEPGAPAPGPGL